MTEANPLHHIDALEAGETWTTDVVVIGAGPVGLFSVFELGLLDIKCHLIDILDKVGGQCAELYPEKPIYDIPAWPIISGDDLTKRLLEQIHPFGAKYHLGEMAVAVRKIEEGEHEGLWEVTTDQKTVVRAKVIVIAAGGGSFQPKKPPIPGIDGFENLGAGKGVHYAVRKMEAFRDKEIVISGGGDSALDWVLDLHGKAASIVHVHRRPEFKAAPASVTRMQQLAAAGSLTFVEGIATGLQQDSGRLLGLTIKRADGSTVDFEADHALAFFGLHPKLGPIAEWQLELDRKAIKVDTAKFQTSIPGIYAVGDINTYPGKKQLILSGFHEAALAAFAIAEHLNPAKKVHLQYTTTSPIMHKRLGVPD